MKHLREWLAERFGDRELPDLFFTVKDHTGCRLLDACSLESHPSRDGRLSCSAGQTKGRKATYVVFDFTTGPAMTT